MTEIEWSDAEREAVEEGIKHWLIPNMPAGVVADDVLRRLAAFVAAREVQAAARAWDEGCGAASTMARCYGHTDHWAEGEEPSNPYERGESS